MAQLSFQQFISLVLKELGAPITQNNINKLSAIGVQEGRHGTFNIMNWSRDAPGATMLNSVVKNYPDLQTGVQQTAAGLSQKNTAALKANLLTDAPFGGFIQAANRFYGTWGGGTVNVSEQAAQKAATTRFLEGEAGLSGSAMSAATGGLSTTLSNRSGSKGGLLGSMRGSALGGMSTAPGGGLLGSIRNAAGGGLPSNPADTIAQAAYQAGFRGQALQWMIQIGLRESGGNPAAHNDNRRTNDDSRGIFQINVLGANGPAIRNVLQGLGRTGDFQDLYNPQINAQVAYRLSAGGTNFNPWRPPGAGGAFGFLSGAEEFGTDAARSAINVQMGRASGTTSLLSNIQDTQQGGGSWASQLTGWLTQQIGKPYRFASTGPDSFDCSGLVSAAYKNALGIDLPPLTFTMKNYGVQVSTDQLQPGDLMFTHGSQGDFGHVGVYVGGGQVIEAPHTGAFVQYAPVDNWIQRANAQGGTVRRILDSNGRLIVGAGLTADHSPDIQTVPAAEASLGPSGDWGLANSQTTQAVDMNQGVDMNQILGTSQPASTFSLHHDPIALPGYGKLVAV